ncbi:MAG: hypothetical protein FJ357_02140 [Thaumarchaeota archaeon]|nr:hypothetical protein [Nitrososphaerota archaeon]
MRIDSCRKCGIELRQYGYAERCQSCGREFAQFTCLKCNLVSDPQYHIHNKAKEALEIVI